MIYTNSKIKQSNGPGAECQRFLILSGEASGEWRMLCPGVQRLLGPRCSRPSTVHDQSPAETLTDRFRSWGLPPTPSGSVSVVGRGCSRASPRGTGSRQEVDGQSPATDSAFLVPTFFPPAPASQRHFLFGGPGGAATNTARCECRNEKPPSCFPSAAWSSPRWVRQGTYRWEPWTDTPSSQSQKDKS